VTDASLQPAPELGAFRNVPYMGVIFVVAEAVKRGFWNGHPDWSNLGQGQPEVGELPGAPARIDQVALEPGDHAYGPLEGTPELREAVASHTNRLFRAGLAPYGPQHVSIAQGGRLALTRCMAALAGGPVGYQLPDYTAYEDMFNLHLDRIEPIGLRTREEDGFALTPADFAAAVRDHGLRAFIVSNPCNPTGVVLAGDTLRELIDIAKREHVTLILDEFYSHFIYTPDGEPGAGPVSGAAFLEDPDRDPIILVDGLTKSFRYPGWRIGWVLGPPPMVEAMARTASSIDGGPSRIAQRAALDALQPAAADQETRALREAFALKRNLMLERLKAMGVRFAHESESTFYLWGCLDGLPAPLNDAMEFFWRALDRKVMTVPGKFFDVNPGSRRAPPSPYEQWMRFSFGPPMDNMVQGLDRLEAMVEEARKG